jgi:predicted MFS family arabinose efflux permease
VVSVPEAHASSPEDTLKAASELATLRKLQQRSTRMVFFIGGVGAAAWASLVPFAKSRVGLDEGTLGLLLLCLGVGSILAMPTAGVLVVRYGCQKVLTAATVVICVALPLLAVVSTFPLLAVTLFVFGAGLGSADCAFNIQAVMVETESRKPLMSGFHGFYSLGGIVGAATVSGVLTLGAAPLTGALAGVALMLAALSVAFRRLLPYGSASEGPRLAIPRGIVLFLGVLCFVVFLVEGAMLDWSAVFLTEKRAMPSAQAGFGFACFSLAMTLGRLTGDAIVKKLGPRVIVAGGGSLATLGIVLTTLVPSWQISLGGYALVGIGCSNIVPVLFSAVGRQRRMPQSVAVPALTTLGYAGILAGPAAIGFIARHSGLVAAFLWVAALMAGVAISSRAFEPAASTPD